MYLEYLGGIIYFIDYLNTATHGNYFKLPCIAVFLYTKFQTYTGNLCSYVEIYKYK